MLRMTGGGPGLQRFQPQDTVRPFIKQEVQTAQPGGEAAHAIPENLVVRPRKRQRVQNSIRFLRMNDKSIVFECGIWKGELPRGLQFARDARII